MLVCAATLLFAAPAARAQTYTPTRVDDPAPNGCKRHDCSLREALIGANNLAGKDTILLGRKTYELRIAPGGPSEDPRTGDLDITDPVAIKHPGKGWAVVDANQIDRVFQQVTSDADRYTKLSRLIIRGGKASNWGGGLLIGNGPVGLTNSIIAGNRAAYDGGGIYASAGELTLMRSTVKGNRAGESGGGVGSIVETVIRNSTLEANTASGATAGLGGGGIAYFGNDLKMSNDTVAGNEAVTDGGGILNYFGTILLNNVTVARNVADSDNMGSGLGAGLRNEGTLTVANSILALNRYGNGSISDCSGTYSSVGRNLITGLVGCAGFSTPPNVLTTQPRIGAIADNGGPTKTIALQTGSPAIGKADKPTAEPRDQRGVTRDTHPDIGAFER